MLDFLKCVMWNITLSVFVVSSALLILKVVLSVLRCAFWNIDVLYFVAVLSKMLCEMFFVCFLKSVFEILLFYVLMCFLYCCFFVKCCNVFLFSVMFQYFLHCCCVMSNIDMFCTQDPWIQSTYMTVTLCGRSIMLPVSHLSTCPPTLLHTNLLLCLVRTLYQRTLIPWKLIPAMTLSSICQTFVPPLTATWF